MRRLRSFGLYKFCICLMVAPMLISGCSHFNDGRQAKTTFAEANDLFHQGSYTASLEKYSGIIDKYPATADRALFEMGIIYAHPKNEQKDYQKSLECFQKLIKDYPESVYRQNSEMMMFNIGNVALKDQTIAAQQMQIETLRHGVQGKENEIVTLQHEVQVKENAIVTLQKEIEAHEKKVFAYAIQKGSVDRILIEKNARRLMLISQGEVLKSYNIALGGTQSVQRNGKVITRPLREPMSSMEETRTAGFTSLCIFPIQTRGTKIAQKNSVFLRAETS